MRQGKAEVAALVAIALIAMTILGSQAEAAGSGADMQACTHLRDDQQRLACFDKAIAAQAAGQSTSSTERPEAIQPGISPTKPTGAAAKSAAEIAPPVSPASGATAPKLTDEQKMGLGPARIQRLESPSVAPEKPAIKELVAKIRSVRANAAGRQIFTLENGQEWQQTQFDPRFRVNPGDPVRITHGALDSFWLSASTHSNTRVLRLR